MTFRQLLSLLLCLLAVAMVSAAVVLGFDALLVALGDTRSATWLRVIGITALFVAAVDLILLVVALAIDAWNRADLPPRTGLPAEEFDAELEEEEG